jgi:hypothetical protein
MRQAGRAWDLRFDYTTTKEGRNWGGQAKARSGAGKQGKVHDGYLAGDDEPAVVLGVVLGDLLEGEDLGRRHGAVRYCYCNCLEVAGGSGGGGREGGSGLRVSSRRGWVGGGGGELWIQRRRERHTAGREGCWAHKSLSVWVTYPTTPTRIGSPAPTQPCRRPCAELGPPKETAWPPPPPAPSPSSSARGCGGRVARVARDILPSPPADPSSLPPRVSPPPQPPPPPPLHCRRASSRGIPFHSR